MCAQKNYNINKYSLNKFKKKQVRLTVGELRFGFHGLAGPERGRGLTESWCATMPTLCFIE